MKKGVIATTCVILLAFVIFYINGIDLTVFTKQGGPGAGFTPRLYLIMGMITSIVVIINADRSKDDSKVSTQNLALKMILLILVYVILIPILGYWLATVVSFITIYRLLGIKDWKLNISLTGGFLVGIYLIFSLFLKVPIQTGILF